MNGGGCVRGIEAENGRCWMRGEVKNVLKQLGKEHRARKQPVGENALDQREGGHPDAPGYGIVGGTTLPWALLAASPQRATSRGADGPG